MTQVTPKFPNRLPPLRLGLSQRGIPAGESNESLDQMTCHNPESYYPPVSNTTVIRNDTNFHNITPMQSWDRGLETRISIPDGAAEDQGAGVELREDRKRRRIKSASEEGCVVITYNNREEDTIKLR
eukprot:sb/3475465/